MSNFCEDVEEGPPDIKTITISTEVDIPPMAARQARKIAQESETPQKHVGDYLDRICLWDVTYCVDGEPIDVVKESQSRS